MEFLRLCGAWGGCRASLTQGMGRFAGRSIRGITVGSGIPPPTPAYALVLRVAAIGGDLRPRVGPIESAALAVGVSGRGVAVGLKLVQNLGDAVTASFQELRGCVLIELGHRSNDADRPIAQLVRYGDQV